MAPGLVRTAMTEWQLTSAEGRKHLGVVATCFADGDNLWSQAGVRSSTNEAAVPSLSTSSKSQSWNATTLLFPISGSGTITS